MDVQLKLATRREIKNSLLLLIQHEKICDDEQLITVLKAKIGVMMEDVGMAIDLAFRVDRGVKAAMQPPPGPQVRTPFPGSQAQDPHFEEM